MIAPDEDDPAEKAAILQGEALALIRRTGLGDVLAARFGRYDVVGSVALDLMSWRDIDLYVPVGRAEPQCFVDALPPIYAAFRRAGHTVFRTTFNDEWFRPRGDYGSGFYWGLRVATDAGAVWKLDLWGWDEEAYARKLREHEQLKQALAKADRSLILRLKRQAQHLPEFRDLITSYDIYRFVMAGEGDSLDELRSFCAARRRDGR